MQDAAPGKDNPPKSPEQLQATLRQAYFAIPVSPFYDIESYGMNEGGKVRFADRLIDRGKLHIIPEIEPLIRKKFDVISQASTTDMFKTMILLPLDRVIIIGRNPKRGDPQGLPEIDFELGLYRALGLDQMSKGGIFTKEGAQEAEEALFEWYAERYEEAIKKLLIARKHPADLEVLKATRLFTAATFTLDQVRQILVDWPRKFVDHYGETFRGIPKDLSEE